MNLNSANCKGRYQSVHSHSPDYLPLQFLVLDSRIT